MVLLKKHNLYEVGLSQYHIRKGPHAGEGVVISKGMIIAVLQK